MDPRYCEIHARLLSEKRMENSFTRKVNSTSCTCRLLDLVTLVLLRVTTQKTRKTRVHIRIYTYASFYGNIHASERGLLLVFSEIRYPTDPDFANERRKMQSRFGLNTQNKQKFGILYVKLTVLDIKTTQKKYKKRPV